MLTVIICDNHKERLKIHQYLDGKEKKVSLYSNLFNAEPTGIFSIEPPCSDKRKYLKIKDAIWYDYGEGFEGGYYSYSINCLCGQGFSYDPDRDSMDRKELYKNNMIVYGSYLKGYSTPSHATQSSNITEEEYNFIISKLKIFTIPKPRTKMTKKELQKYVNEQIKILM